MIFLKKLNLLLLCAKYGYFFVFLGALLEGDMITITAGYNAYLGQFKLLNLILFVLTVTVVADQIVFFLGKKYKNKIQELMATKSKEDNFFVRKVKKTYLYFHKYGNFIGIIFRFLTSVRLITPFVLGTTEMSQVRFLFLNIIGGIMWVLLMCGGGYVFAHYCSYETALHVFQYMPIIGICIMVFLFIKSFFED